MRSLLNTQRARLGRFTASTATAAGLILLCLAAAIAIFLPKSSSPLPILLIGILFAWTGIHTSNRWLRPPIPHQAIDNALKGLSKDTTIYHYYLPAEHVLICYKGIIALKAQAQDITLTINGEEWENNERFLTYVRRALTLDIFINPYKSATANEAKLHKWLTRILPHTIPTVHTIIVFTNPKAKLDISKQPSILVTYADKHTPTLKAMIRQLPDTLTQEQLKQITNLINKKLRISEVPNEQHAKET